MNMIRIAEVALAIVALASTEHVTVPTGEAVRAASATVQASSRHGVSEWTLLGIAWRESRLDPAAIGDQGRSCGPTQIRHDFDGRPSCVQSMRWSVAMDWTAHELARLRRTCDSTHYLAAYNAGCTGWRVRGYGVGYQQRVRAVEGRLARR